MFGRKSDYQRYLERLSALEPFRSLDRRGAARAASLTTTVLRGPGCVLWREGEPALEAIIVVRGRVATTSADGDSEFAGPGGVVGAGELLARSTRASTAVVAEGAELLVMNRREFRSLLQVSAHHPSPAPVSHVVETGAVQASRPANVTAGY